MIEAAQLRKGTVVRLDGDLCRVFEYQLNKLGRGGANVKTKMRNLSTGAMIDRTFNSDERLEDVRLESRRVQYLYNDGDLYHFMDVETFEQPYHKVSLRLGEGGVARSIVSVFHLEADVVEADSETPDASRIAISILGE